jgi:small subunit ribosomal protein S16
MQRTGRKGHAMFRIVVQESKRTPSSGKVVMFLGSYDPHTKSVILAKDKAEFYLSNGAQPSPRVTQILKSEGIKLPNWVLSESKKQGELRNPEKLRRNRPAEEPKEAPEASEEAEVKPATEEVSQEVTSDDPKEAATEITEEVTPEVETKS